MKIIYSFLITIIVYGQITFIYSQQVKDFKISSDNSPSTIIQNSPKLFCDGNKRFLTTWKDYRNGEETTFAQWFDSMGNKVGENFRIYNDNEITFNKDESFLTSNGWIGPYYWPTYDGYYLHGKIYKPNGESSKEFAVFDILHAFDVDPLGIDYRCIAKNDRFIYFIRVEGTIISRAFDINGNLIYDKSFNAVIPFRMSTIACAVDKNNNSILCGFNARRFNINSDNPDSMSIGVYANIFDANDSLKVKNKLIKAFYPSDELYNTPLLKCISIGDTLWEIFWLDKESRTLSFEKIDNKGEPIDEINTISFPYESSTFINNFSFSPVQNNKFLVYISSEGYLQNNWTIYYNTLLSFDSNGNLINQTVKKEGVYTELNIRSNNIFQFSDSSFWAVSSNDRDIFLHKVKTLSILENHIINDDSVGNNETSPTMTVIDKDNCFISWKSETKNIGIQIDFKGNLIGIQKEFEGDGFFFLPNGYYYNFWIVRKLEGCIPSSHKGYTLYDSSGKEIKKDSLIINGYDDNQPIKAVKLSDSTFIMYYTNGEKLFLKLLSDKGDIIRESDFDFSGSNAELFCSNDTSFILSWNGKIQYFNTDLEKSSDVFDLYFDLYIGDNKFLKVVKSNWNSDLYGTIVSAQSDTLVGSLKITSNIQDVNQIDEFSLYRLSGDEFLTIFRKNNQIYAKVFSSEGKERSNGFIIHSDIQSSKKQPTVVINGNKVFFAWADARNEGRGYDIYGSIFDLSKVVEVEEQKQNELPNQFSLSQNYPNPFNPSTTIQYTIPALTSFLSPNERMPEGQVKVTLKVYDVLGKEVATLVNEIQNAGSYNCTFSINNYRLSSGIYFYQLRVSVPTGKAGSFTQTKKFVLLK